MMLFFFAKVLSMNVCITTLIENSLGEHTGLVVEHGLSFLIERGKDSVLFDVGQSSKFLHNAQKLEKDLSLVSHVVLSHGHYDHSGGFRPFAALSEKHHLALWTGKGFFDRKYGKFGPSLQYLGNDFDAKFLESHGIEHHVVVEGKTEIVPGVWGIAGFSRTHTEEPVNPRFCKQTLENGLWQEDTFEDEMLLVVESEKGLIVIVGCAHPGILNMLDTVTELFDQKIYALLGGTHLVEADKERVDKTLSHWKDQEIGVLGISHCSGSLAIEQSLSMKESNFHNCTGSSIILQG
jgi:7,8-dihydropterin-6-yl-methyl-4-(beta-D-ribofuranosyl)aminobenzene 5'-phosphate synthase